MLWEYRCVPKIGFWSQRMRTRILECLLRDSLAFKSRFTQGAPNPYFYRCKFSVCIKHDLKFDFSGKTRRILKQQLRSAAEPPRCCCTLCVCFCVPLSLNLNENPYRSETSVREKCRKARKQRQQSPKQFPVNGTKRPWQEPARTRTNQQCSKHTTHYKSCDPIF